MLRVTQQSSSAAAVSYFSKADYFIDGQELNGHWGGKGAQLLGLEGEVTKEAFERLCHNLHPDTGSRLTSRTRSDRTVGMDFTFSVSKSVSLLYSLHGDQEILEAFRSAVSETMQDIEADAMTRIRKKNQNEELVTGNLTYAEFVHFTGRPVEDIPDPQLHAHCFVLNSTLNQKENAWRAVQFRELKRDAPMHQAAFRARLANKLTALGYQLERKKDDFEIKGVAKETIDAFSRRTKQVDDAAEAQGITHPAFKAQLGKETRERKNNTLGMSELVEVWNNRLSSTEREQIQAASVRTEPTRPSVEAAKESVRYAIEHCFERNSVVAEKELLKEALRHGLGQVTVEDVRKAYEETPLIRECKYGRRFVTTHAVVREEKEMIAFARNGRGTQERLGVEGRVISRKWLNQGQQKAVKFILESRDRVILVRGAAGTGKTTMVKEAVEAIQENGRQVVMLAPSAAASRGVLREAGFAGADTVAAFLHNKKLQEKARGQVLWIDESGQLGSRDVAALFSLADRLDARIVLQGDRFQHGSVSRGSPLRLLEEEAGVPSAHVTEILRQSGDYKKAVEHLSEGRVEEGFKGLDDLGWILEVPTEERYRLLADHYLQTIEEEDSKGNPLRALVVAPSHAEGRKVTEAIRDGLKEKKLLGEEHNFQVWAPTRLTEAERGEAENYHAGDMLQFHQNAKGYQSGQRVVVQADGKLPLEHAKRFQSFRPADLSLAVGDKIRITNNGKTQDGEHKLNNGMVYTVQGFTKSGDILIDHNWVIDKGWGHITHGYTVTSHASQGRSVDRVLVAQSAESFPASSREQWYVSASRGEKQVLVFTDSKKQLLEAVRRSSERLNATDLLKEREQRLMRHLAFLRRSVILNLPKVHIPAHQLNREPGKELVLG